MTMEGMAPEDILRMEQENKMGEEVDETREKIALLLIGFQAELSEARQLDPTHYFVDKAVNQAVLGIVDKIISTVEEWGYRKLPKDKPPLLSDGDIEGVCISSLGLKHQTYTSPLEFRVALAVAQAQWDVCIKHYEG